MTDDATDEPAPAPAGQRFTIGLDAEGGPVRRTVAGMTMIEVLAAFKWQDEVVTRMDAAAEGARRTVDAMQAGHVITQDELAQAMETMRAHVVELKRKADLLIQVRAAMPRWDKDWDLAEALRRGWPR
jgi:hypothetical protein